MDGVIQRRLDPTIRFKDPSSRIQVPRLAANIANKAQQRGGHTVTHLEIQRSIGAIVTFVYSRHEKEPVPLKNLRKGLVLA